MLRESGDEHHSGTEHERLLLALPLVRGQVDVVKNGDRDHVESDPKHVHHRRAHLGLDLTGSERAYARVVQPHADVERAERQQSEPVTHEKDGQRQRHSRRRIHVTRDVVHLGVVMSE